MQSTNYYTLPKNIFDICPNQTQRWGNSCISRLLGWWGNFQIEGRQMQHFSTIDGDKFILKVVSEKKERKAVVEFLKKEP